jgi:cyclopropane-fatty-acyl-phospholipid synthase
MTTALELTERGLLPDWLIRLGIRIRDRRLIEGKDPGDLECHRRRMHEFIQAMRDAPIAPAPEKANLQHYEAPAEFFKLVLGKRLKYSSCYWPVEVESLDAAEEAMLDLTCRRAELSDGMDVLDLGCGWGSLTGWIAENYRECRVLAVSNSKYQATTIREGISEKRLGKVEVETADVNNFRPDRTFDRVVSVEMFEHARNWQALLARISSWLKPNGKLFVHVFSHWRTPFLFQAEGENDWMARHFFTEGLMPSDDLILYFQDDLIIEDHWRISGLHYQKTADAWLANLDKNKAEIVEIARRRYGNEEAKRWAQRWRIFFMAVSEMWGYRGGEEWIVSHYRFTKRQHA